MMWLYVMLVALVAGAVPATVWLKRAGDREWRAHQRQEKRRAVYVRLIADTEGFTRAMRDASAAVAGFGAEMHQAKGPLERLGRDLDGFLKRILPPMCRQCGPGYRIGVDGCRHTGRDNA
jgi:hypothetical protein